jgi:hypothetical protein
VESAEGGGSRNGENGLTVETGTKSLIASGDTRLDSWLACDSGEVTTESPLVDCLLGDGNFFSWVRTDSASRNAVHSSWT